MIAHPLLYVGLLDLYRNDEVLCDKACIRFSLDPKMQSTEANPTEFELFSDRVVRIFPTYVLDNRLRIRPGPETPRVKLQWLKELLLSKDLERNPELDWINDCKGLRFLESSEV